MGIGGAFAFTPKTADPCAGVPLYYFNGTTHVLITDGGASGCNSSFNESCKYYDAGGGSYLPCDITIYGRGRYRGN
jgi:hypothetical protein